MKTQEVAQFEFEEIIPIAITFVVIGVALAYGVSIQSDIRDEFIPGTWNCGLNASNGTGAGKLYTGCPLEYNVTDSSMKANDTLADKLPTIAKIMVAAIIIGILVSYMWMRFKNP